ncbi:MAG: PAS domain-containing sensor histidine kinase [Actinomycetota bacterium]
MQPATEPFAREGVLRRVAPFALVAGATTVAAALSFTPGHGAEVAVAGALTGLLTAVAVRAQWDRLPRWTQAIVPIAYYVVVALLRDATGAGRTPYTALVFLPVVWFALYGSRFEVGLALLTQAATLAAPVALFGGPQYPPIELQRAGLSVSMAAFIGLVVHGLVANLRESADEVARQAESIKAAEAQARESRDLLAGVLEAATEYSIIGTDPNGLITVFNEGASRMLGYSAEEMVGLHTPELIHDPEEVVRRANALGIRPGLEVFVAAARSGRPVTSDWTYLRKSGERLRVALTITATRGAGEVPSGFIWIATDVTDQRRAEAEVRDRAERGSLINEMIGEVRQDLDPSSIMRRAVTALGEVTSADRCLIRLASEGDIGGVTEQWVREGIAPIDPEIALPEPLARLGEQSIREDRSLSIPDAMNDARLTPDEAKHIVDKLGARAYLGAPMWMGTRLVGWLVLHAVGEVRNWTARDTAITEALARNVGPAILQAQSYLQEQEMVRKLRELDQAKSDFVSSVSHELRTPLTSITGYLEMLVDGDAGPLSSDQLDLLEVVDRNSQRLLMLIEDLLTLSRIESGRLGMAREPVDTLTLISGVEKAVLPLLSGRSLAFDVDVPADLGSVVGDFSQLERVLLNLLTNAIKFTPDGGRISLVGRAFDGAISLSVADTGIGIPEDEQHKLFTRFFRSSSAQQRAIQGTGLGLAIVKSIVEQHGGSIEVESTPDVGTTLTVELPTQLEVGEEDGTE